MEFEPALSDRSQWSINDACSMTRVLEVLSTKTTFQVFANCSSAQCVSTTSSQNGKFGTQRSRTLKQLEAASHRGPCPLSEPGRRARDEYRLTEAGEDLLPVFMSLVQWGTSICRTGAPAGFLDAHTGRPVSVHVTAGGGRSPARAGDIEIQVSRSR